MSRRKKSVQEQNQSLHLNLNVKVNLSHYFQLLYTTPTMFFKKEILMTGSIDQVATLSITHLVLTFYTH